jgi:hypothetical protein
VRDEDTYVISRDNKLPEAATWMRPDGLTAADWAVVTEYIDVLKPLKSATKRLEARGKDADGRVGGGRYGAIPEVIPVFEYILTYYEQRVKAYESVDTTRTTKRLKTILRSTSALPGRRLVITTTSSTSHPRTMLQLYSIRAIKRIASSSARTNLSSWRQTTARFAGFGQSTTPHHAR